MADAAYVPGKILRGLRDEILHLRAQLKKHGGHTAECDSLKIYELKFVGEDMEPVVRDPAPECDCGWAEIEKGCKR